MDAAIYVHISFYDTYPKPPQKTYLKNRLMVVDDAGDVQNLILPDIGQNWFHDAGIAVAISRLFIIGGYLTDCNGKVDLNGIVSANIIGGDHSWETKPLEDPLKELCYMGGAAVSKKGDCIYAIGRKGILVVFDHKNMTLKQQVSGAPSKSIPILLAVTDTRIYVNCVSRSDPMKISIPSDNYSTLGYYDIESLK